MARNRYRPYRTRKTKNRNLIYIILAVLVLGGLVFVGLKLGPWKKEPPLAGPTDEQGVITPQAQVSEPQPEPDSEPAASPEPGESEPQAPAVPPEPEQVPEYTPAQDQPPEPMNVEETPRPQPESAATIVNPQANALIVQANQDYRDGRIIAARDKLNDVLMMEISRNDRENVRKIMARLAERWLFSKEDFPQDPLTEIYQVRPGDTLGEIGAKYKVPYELLMEINSIADARSLRAGQTLKAVKGPFHVKIYLNEFRMDVYLGKNTYVKSYPVGIGKAQKDTPGGKWIVPSGGKHIRPVYTDPDTHKVYHSGQQGYPIGARYIELQGLQGDAVGRTGFAIHGTNDPESIGKAASKGCIRMQNADVIELFNMLYAGRSEVLTVSEGPAEPMTVK